MITHTPSLGAGRLMPSAGLASLTPVFSAPRNLRVDIVQAFASIAPSAQQGLDLLALFRNFGSTSSSAPNPNTTAPPPAAPAPTAVSNFRWG